MSTSLALLHCRQINCVLCLVMAFALCVSNPAQAARRRARCQRTHNRPFTLIRECLFARPFMHCHTQSMHRGCPRRRTRCYPSAVPRIIGITEQRLDENGKWIPVPDSEVSWSHDKLRSSPILEPNDFSQVVSIRFLKRPSKQPNAEWQEFARTSRGHRWAEGNPGVGIWDITVEVRFCSGAIVTLHNQTSDR